jgi:long-subunit acyl-CoA synthetase (AMP-forming)
VAHHQEDMASYETIKKIHVLDRALVVGEDLTPTLKVKRKEMMRRFEREIAALYEI